MAALELRRLEPSDADLLREAYSWDRDSPDWYKSMDKVFGPQTVDEFIGLVDDPTNALIGVFNPELTALITVSMAEGKGRYVVHLWAKRATSTDVVVEAGYQIREQLVEQLGAQEIFTWVAKRNYQVRNICLGLGLQPDGLEFIKGCYKNRVIVWQRFVFYFIMSQQAEMAA